MNYYQFSTNPSPKWRKPPWPRAGILGCLLLGLFLWPVQQSLAQAVNETEEPVKAAMVYKLSRFVTWTQGRGGEAETLEICVAENDDFGTHLDEMQRQLRGRREIRIRHFKNGSDNLETCHLVFISKSARTSVQQILDEVSSTQVLTIGDLHGFARSGGMIEITRRNKRLGFIVNMQAVRESGLLIAAPLLQMSTLINEVRK